MSARTDILDQPERLRGPFLSSLVLHVGGVGLFVAATVTHFMGGEVIKLGDPNGGGAGSLAVTVTPVISLPSKPAPANPVANDTKSQVPQAPPKQKTKPQPKTKAIEPDAIPLPSRNARTRPTPQAAAPNRWAEEHPARPNQLTSSTGAAVSSPLYQKRGGGGVDVGTNSPFGEQLGWYADLLRQAIEQHWQKAGISPGTGSTVTVQFTLLRNGTVAPGSVRVTETSGNRALDISAQRAILDVGQFPVFPPQFPRERADMQIQFDLRR